VSAEAAELTLRFAVTDTGIGIPQERMQILFSPFVQADASTTRNYGGTGLGLAISKRLVELMGGKIGFESGEGQGSTFWFTVVFRRASTPVLAAAVEPLPGLIDRATDKGRRARILVAEDNATNRALALAQLEKLGYCADTVVDGAAAVEALREGAYDLVLMDCEMPVMDGYEATAMIRQLNIPRIPIIAVTAHAMPGDRDKCLRAGMDDFLSKPVDIHQLSAVLAKWSQKGFLRPAVGTAEPPHIEPMVTGFDRAALLERLMGDRELAQLIVNGFLADFPTRWNDLRLRLAERDQPGARMLAHTLKGSSATVSATTVSAICLQMEVAAANGQLDHCGELLARVGEEFARFKSTLEHCGWSIDPGRAIDLI
jgi:CheY-like chemotaxis protein